MKGKLMVLCVFLVACVLMLSACTQEPKTLIDAESLQVTRTGAKISVYDRLGGNVYNFITTRHRRSEGPQKAAMLVDTDTAGTMQRFYQALKANSLRVKDISYVLATHYHPDHMGLISALVKQGVGLLLLDVQKPFVHFSDPVFSRAGFSVEPIDERTAFP